MTVALCTSAGEGDFSSDKLSNLKTVVSGFGPLIYELPPESNFATFQEICKTLWETVEKSPELPKLLVNLLQT